MRMRWAAALPMKSIADYVLIKYARPLRRRPRTGPRTAATTRPRVRRAHTRRAPDAAATRHGARGFRRRAPIASLCRFRRSCSGRAGPARRSRPLDVERVSKKDAQSAQMCTVSSQSCFRSDYKDSVHLLKVKGVTRLSTRKAPAGSAPGFAIEAPLACATATRPGC